VEIPVQNSVREDGWLRKNWRGYDLGPEGR